MARTTQTKRQSAGSTRSNRTTAASRQQKNKKTTKSQTGAGKAGSDGQEQSQSLLEKLFVNMLQGMYWSEKQLVTALQTMQSQAATEELQDAIENHAYATQKHASRLERVFSQLGMEPAEKECAAMQGLIADATQAVEETREGTMTRDAALIIAAQQVEHYEIATYGSLVQLALTLEYDNIAGILEKTLWEEEDTDQLLTEIAESYVNPMADDEPEEATMEIEEEEEVEVE